MSEVSRAHTHTHTLTHSLGTSELWYAGEVTLDYKMITERMKESLGAGPMRIIYVNDIREGEGEGEEDYGSDSDSGISRAYVE